MYIISDRHFSPTLQAISRHLKLSPEIAACTLLAIGNGAPDFFTLQSSNVSNLIILSSCISSSLIILTCVFGAVIYFAYVPNRSGTNSHGLRPLNPSIFIRNASVFLLGLFCLAIPLYLGYIPIFYPIVLISIYVIHIAIVGYLSMNRKSSDDSPFMDDDNSLPLKDSETASVSGEMIKATTASEIRREQLLALERFHKHPFTTKIFLSLSDTSFKDFFNHPMEGPSHMKWFLMLIKKTFTFIFLCPISLTILPVDTGLKSSSHDISGDEDDGGEDIEYLTDSRYASKRFLNRLRCTVNPWFSIPFAFSVFTSISEIPSENWTYTILVYLFLSSLFSTTIWHTTSWFGAPSYSSFHLLWGFLMTMRWMLFVGDILTSVMDISGKILNLPSDLLSMIILAWGNSAPDILSSISLAKRCSMDGSGFKTASIAIFSAPIQNIFLTVGITTFIKGNHSKIEGNLKSSKVALGILMIISIVSFLLIKFKFAFKIPRWFGGLLCIMYLVYLPFGVLSSIDN